MPAPAQGDNPGTLVGRFDRLDASLCRLLNRSSRIRSARALVGATIGGEPAMLSFQITGYPASW